MWILWWFPSVRVTFYFVPGIYSPGPRAMQRSHYQKPKAVNRQRRFLERKEDCR